MEPRQRMQRKSLKPTVRFFHARYLQLLNIEYLVGDGGAKVIGIECDVASQESVQHAYSQVLDTFHRIDSVVASAGKCSAKLYLCRNDSLRPVAGIGENFPALE